MTELDAILDKISVEAAELAPDGETALGLLQEVYRNKRVPLHTRMRAATIAIQYETPRLAVTGVVRDDEGFAHQLEKAIARSRAGKVLELTATNGGSATDGEGELQPR
jgi:hypothetical protein